MDTASQIEEGDQWVPTPEQLRQSTFGFDSLVSDYYWLMTIQLVGGEQGSTEQHAPLIGRLIDNVTTLLVLPTIYAWASGGREAGPQGPDQEDGHKDEDGLEHEDGHGDGAATTG